MSVNLKEMFDQLTHEIDLKRAELGACLRKAQELEDLISGLQQSASGLAKTIGQQYVAEGDISLTEAIRRIFRQGQTKTFVPTEIRDALIESGYDIDKYGNILASIHSIIKRILGKDIVEAGKRADGRVAYKWKRLPETTKAPSPPHEVAR